MSADGDVGRVVVDGDLLGLGALDAQHPHDLAVGRDAVGAHVRGRGDQEDVLLLPPLQGALLHHDRADEVHLGLDQIRAQGSARGRSSAGNRRSRGSGERAERRPRRGERAPGSSWVSPLLAKVYTPAESFRLPLPSNGKGGTSLYSCETVRSELSNLVDGELAERLRREVDHHLSECRACRALYDSTRKTLTIVSDAGGYELDSAGLRAADAEHPRQGHVAARWRPTCPATEAARLEGLRRYEILDTPAEPRVRRSRAARLADLRHAHRRDQHRRPRPPVVQGAGRARGRRDLPRRRVLRARHPRPRPDDRARRPGGRPLRGEPAGHGRAQHPLLRRRAADHAGRRRARHALRHRPCPAPADAGAGARAPGALPGGGRAIRAAQAQRHASSRRSPRAPRPRRPCGRARSSRPA